MDGYRAALEDIDQALAQVPCRCPIDIDVVECRIYRADIEVIIEGALRGCEPP
jgi:hypothetical protein